MKWSLCRISFAWIFKWATGCAVLFCFVNLVRACACACMSQEQFAAAAVVDRMRCWFIVACKLHLEHTIDMQLLWFAVRAPGSFKLNWPAKCLQVIGRPVFSLKHVCMTCCSSGRITEYHSWRCVRRWNVCLLYLLSLHRFLAAYLLLKIADWLERCCATPWVILFTFYLQT